MCSKSHIACDYHFAAFFACTFDNNMNDFASDLSAKKERGDGTKQESDSSGEFLIKAERRKPSHFDDKRSKALKKYVAISINIVSLPNMCLGRAQMIRSSPIWANYFSAVVNSALALR